MSLITIFVYLIFVLCLIYTSFILVFYEWRWPSYRKKCRQLPAPKQNIIFGIGWDLMKVKREGTLF